MLQADIYLLAVSTAGIGLAIWLIAKVGVHPFVGLICGALAIGLAVGMEPMAVIKAIEKGFGDILGGTGIVVALGLGLGAILQMSGGAQALASTVFGWTGQRYATWGGLLAALLLGLPLFFETGVVLLLPIIGAGFSFKEQSGSRLKVMLSALAGLSVLHALLPPHPGPLIAITQLAAPIPRTMLFGLVAAIPTALIAGPLLARYTTRGVTTLKSDIPEPVNATASPVAACIVLLFPVVLIGAGAVARLDPWANAPGGWIAMLADPVFALLLANALGLMLLFGRQALDRPMQEAIWRDAIRPASGILLSIGAGGALKQVLVSAELPQLFANLATLGLFSPVLLAWLVAAAIRVATGSATVATITAAGVMAGVADRHLADPTFLVLAIGAGSVFLSHINDPGFWLVRGYLGVSTRDTFRVWSTLETVISLVGLAMVILLQKTSGMIWPGRA